MEEIYSKVDELAVLDDDRIAEIEENIRAVSGAVMEYDHPGYIRARRLASELYKRDAAGLDSGCGPKMTVEGLEKIERVLDDGLALSENFHKVEERRFSVYDGSSYGHDDHVLMVSAAEMAKKMVDNRPEYDRESETERPKPEPEVEHRWK